MMAIYHVITNRFTRPVIERHIAQGREEGREEGVETSNRAWREWLRRRDEAQAEGRPFDEPPPDEQSRRNGKGE